MIILTLHFNNFKLLLDIVHYIWRNYLISPHASINKVGSLHHKHSTAIGLLRTLLSNLPPRKQINQNPIFIHSSTPENPARTQK